jgi:hypothetical protein
VYAVLPETVWKSIGIRNCIHCHRWFEGKKNIGYCSDWCRAAALAARRAAWIEHRSAARAAARQEYCYHCGKAMLAVRSTKRFCSARCRAAAARYVTLPRRLLGG